MAHVRGLTKSPEWWAHLRPYNKRKVSKAERRASKSEIEREMDQGDDTPKGLGLSKNPKEMARLKKEQGELVVSRGMYCYDEKGNCPFWDKAENKPEQGNGYCWLRGEGDWDDGVDLLFDQCKNCGIKYDEIPEGTFPVEDEE